MSTTLSPPPMSELRLPVQPHRIDMEHHSLELMRSAISRFRSASVQIQMHDDMIMLTGVADSYHSKQTVQESLRTLAGRRLIRNELEVKTRTV